MSAKIRRDDFVEVVSGKDKGRTGKILRVFPKEGLCLVEKVAMVKRHQKARGTGAPSGIIEKNAKIPLSKVMLLDSKTKKPSRVKFELKDGKKIRHYVKSGAVVD